MRPVIGVIFLAAQFFSIIYAQFGLARYFCWAPNDYIVEYALEVRIRGRILSPKEIRGRYRIPGTGIYQNTIQHLIDAVGQYEATYGHNDHARILLTYRTNGGPDQQWRWNKE
jgi:hypothetical protein